MEIAANPLFMRVAGLLDGAGEMNRTPDLLITNEPVNALTFIDLDARNEFYRAIFPSELAFIAQNTTSIIDLD